MCALKDNSKPDWIPEGYLAEHYSLVPRLLSGQSSFETRLTDCINKPRPPLVTVYIDNSEVCAWSPLFTIIL